MVLVNVFMGCSVARRGGSVCENCVIAPPIPLRSSNSMIEVQPINDGFVADICGVDVRDLADEELDDPRDAPGAAHAIVRTHKETGRQALIKR